MAFKFPDKDPDEKLDYTVDWSRYLQRDNLTIASVTWKIEKADGTVIPFSEGYSFQNDELVLNSVATTGLTNILIATPTNTTSTIVLDKGQANKTYTLICEITTSTSSKTTDTITTNRRIKLKVRERI
jgi:hypothetical protein